MTYASLDTALIVAFQEACNQGAKLDSAAQEQAVKSIKFKITEHDLPCAKLSIRLESFKNRNTKKYAQIQIWFHDNGRFESNAYCM